VILDACRNNPFLTTMRRSNGTRAVSRGLTRVEPDGDMLVAYAAREGATADDGEGADSPFTKAVAKWLTTPGVEMHLLFGKVRDDVRKATDNRQEPAIYGSLGGDEYYFVPPNGAATGAASASQVEAARNAQLKTEAERNRQLRVASAGALLGAKSGGGGPPPAAGASAGASGGGSGGPPLAGRSAFGGNPGAGDTNLFASGLAHIERQEWAAAIADFDAIIRFRPQNAGAWHNRARARYGAGDVDGAIADMTRAIRLLPTNDDSYIARARFYRLKLLWELALADNNQAIALKPDAEAYLQRGLTYEGKGDAAAAAADYARALSINPRLPRAIQAQTRIAKRR
jgi:tetratricopeptide (TPR) repeat protein